MKRRPNQLSGGQSQRVAIGRAIVKEPKAFLFDEPLSNLDAELRVKMRGELVALHRRLKSTMIYVTHDQVEAMTMADQIVVLREGVVEQAGSPVELYARPANRFVAGFLGAPQMNFIQGRIERRNGAFGLALDGGVTVALPGRDARLPDGAPVTVGIRPEHAEVGSGPLEIRVEATEILGSETIIHARLQSGQGFTPGPARHIGRQDRRPACRSRCLRPLSICSTKGALPLARRRTGAATIFGDLRQKYSWAR